jgi:hypothetical protein
MKKAEMIRKSARRRTFGAVAAAALLAFSACSTGEGDGVASAGGEDNPATPEATEDAALLDADAQALVFAECMRDNGIDMPDPGPGQEGLGEAFRAAVVAGDNDRATVEEAFAACEDLLPQYPSEEEHVPDDMLALAECLREQGLDVSDNPFDDAHSGAIDVDEFSAAMEVCRDKLTGGGQ